MKTTFNRTFKQPFLLRGEQISSLAKILEDRVARPSVSVACADSASRSFESVSDLLDYENPKNRKITSLSLEADRYNQGETTISTEVTYSTHDYSFLRSDIRVIVRGTDEWAAVTMQELEEVITGSRPWYWWFCIMHVLFLWIPCMLSIQLVLTLTGLTAYPEPPALVNAIILGTWSFWLAWAAAYVSRYLFPAGVFLIGQEKERIRTKKRIRMAIVWVVPVLLGFIVLLFV